MDGSSSIIIIIIFIIIIIIISKKIPRVILKYFWFFRVFFYQFCIILGYIFYAVRCKSGIKIPGFLWNVSKTILKIKKKSQNF
jgi:phage-related holin